MPDANEPTNDRDASAAETPTRTPWGGAAEAAGTPAAAEADKPAAEPQPEERIAALEAQTAELKDQLLRALAEAENTRRRARKEIEDTARYAVTNLAKDVLSAPDNLRRALDAIPADGRKEDALLDRLAAGVELVERELLAILERYGIKKIEPLGQPFDHNLHQALFEMTSADHPPGTVVQVLAPGYLIQDRLLRAAMVAVAKAPPPAGGERGGSADTSN
ncbi:MAG: nucleotide exchange factor GrpE [Alphaproteobacteria bacterium]